MRRHERQGNSNRQTRKIVRDTKGGDNGRGDTQGRERAAGMDSCEQTGEEGSSSSSEDEARSS